ncbi:hypothetical protein GW915_07030 [bacterium]|nr:hypothetical protein [bacterium]
MNSARKSNRLILGTLCFLFSIFFGQKPLAQNSKSNIGLNVKVKILTMNQTLSTEGLMNSQRTRELDGESDSAVSDNQQYFDVIQSDKNHIIFVYF